MLKIVSENHIFFKLLNWTTSHFETGRGPFTVFRIYLFKYLYIKVYIIYIQFNFHHNISFCSITGQYIQKISK